MKQERYENAALTALIILQAIMLLSLFAGIAPHPPKAIVLFGIAPFLAVSLSFAAGAMIIGPEQDTVGKGLSLAAALCALLSFGPQKYIDPQLPLIWPAVLAGQVCALFILVKKVRSFRKKAV